MPNEAPETTTDFDEFSLFEQNCAEAHLLWVRPPTVERISVPVSASQHVSALRWGHGDPELVLLHGGAQNAHTWDTVALALNRPLLAIDLPGHGRSDWRQDRDYWPIANAEAIASVMREPGAGMPVIGMSLGGLTAIRLAATAPELVTSVVVVDVTPGVTMEKSAPIADFVQGPESFASFDDMLARTVQHHPTRSVESLRRGLLHNAHALPDGRWIWRYDRLRPPNGELNFGELWNDLERVRVPMMLVIGSDSGVVASDDAEEFRRRQPTVRLETITGAGHSIQGDQPVRLAALIDSFLAAAGDGSS